MKKETQYLREFIKDVGGSYNIKEQNTLKKTIAFKWFCLGKSLQLFIKKLLGKK